uniref:Uncharacterized protein n=1 Tax=Solanum tuberosum TaxID=4113 RepID=M1CAF5_SOLTU
MPTSYELDYIMHACVNFLTYFNFNFSKQQVADVSPCPAGFHKKSSESTTLNELLERTSSTITP